MKLKTVELFCGTKSFSKVAEKLGHETFTVDINKSFNPDLINNLLNNPPKKLLEKIDEADIIWMSPPCTTFSMASGNKHWTKDRKPKTKSAEIGLALLSRCKLFAMHCIKYKKIYFIENPRARARWFMPEETRHTVWYCQYGDKRAKPTDIWTNLENWEGKTCKNGNPKCHHERAPRGSKTGTQGLENSKLRGIIPEKLFYEIFNILEEENEK